MRRTTIVMPDELRLRAKQVAHERGISMATLIRQALEEELKRHRPKPKSLGIGNSGVTDTSRRIGEERVPPWPWR